MTYAQEQFHLKAKSQRPRAAFCPIKTRFVALLRSLVRFGFQPCLPANKVGYNRHSVTGGERRAHKEGSTDVRAGAVSAKGQGPVAESCFLSNKDAVCSAVAESGAVRLSTLFAREQGWI